MVLASRRCRSREWGRRVSRIGGERSSAESRRTETAVAEADGNRTRQPTLAGSPVLKTGEDTSPRSPPPRGYRTTHDARAVLATRPCERAPDVLGGRLARAPGWRYEP